MRSLLLINGLLLAGCRGLIEIPPQQAQVIAPSGATEIVQTPGGSTEIIEPAPKVAPDWCLVQARRYKGLVPKLCAEVAREVR